MRAFQATTLVRKAHCAIPMPTTRSQASKRGFLTEAEALDIARKAKTVAVLGIKTEQKANQPAFYVPAYLASQGKNVIPIPVYFPDVKEILGRPVKRRVSEVEGNQAT
uniref:CoA-binding domain-containing protein n=1 Tax=Dunaliella tertiolecta TaxID=3047 RepID=A0A7S3VHF5_DUNTE|mmetsp:Transcript_22605/g.62450  ORF Transcript_22605/g.62450 Transcript_22605/m.62450 type:complete len:108 (+) Transcript_22605:67-390(+)